MIILGSDRTGQTRTAEDEDACLVLGPPRSGKTSGVIAPTVLGHPGPCLVTSSKWDVAAATLDVRLHDGPVWVFTPDGRVPFIPGATVHPASWSPLPSCQDWDTALLHARAMTGATIRRGHDRNEDQFWHHQAERLLAALLHAAALADVTMAEVAGWTLNGRLDQPASHLQQHDAEWAHSILDGVDRGHDRYRDSVLATASDVLRVYDHTHARRHTSRPTFPIDDFLDGSGTLYIVAPSEHHDLHAPLIVGLIEDILRTAFRRAAEGPVWRGTLLLALDELARIAPLHQLPGWLAETGSHHVQVLGVLQDLSQARARWGPDVADGFLTLFRHKLLLPGVLDKNTLEQVAAVLGEDLWSPAPGTLTTRPRWTPNTLTAGPPGTAVHLDRGHAATLTLVNVNDPATHPQGAGR